MIVLQAPNPWGDKLGTVAAIIFAYLSTDANSGTTDLDFAICGNADYAMSYLHPAQFPLPPTPVTLQAVYTNPMSEELPARYLSSFEGHCGLMGRGYLGGDFRKISKNAIKYTYKACFAPSESAPAGVGLLHVQPHALCSRHCIHVNAYVTSAVFTMHRLQPS